MEAKAETKKYIIRRAEPEDYEALTRILGGPKAIWGTLQLPYPSVDGWRKRLADPMEAYISLLACVDGEPIGQIGLATFPKHPRRRHAGEIGMCVRDDWQGQGVGSALMQAVVDMADRWLNLTRLELIVYTDNEAAVKLYKKFGFAVEGTLVQYAFRDGCFVDAYTMARVRSV